MTQPNPLPAQTESGDAPYWAELATARLMVRDIPPGAVNLNVEGHRVFGPLWKTTAIAAEREVARDG